MENSTITLLNNKHDKKTSHSLDGLRSNWFGVVRQIKQDIAYEDTIIKPSSLKNILSYNF